MDITIEPGMYVVAVSGGVDSVVLLHALQGRPDVRIVVAHYDHGIRPDSGQDRLHVQGLARRYGLPFVFDEGRLGTKASEAVAREARYAFLHKTRQAVGADAIVTAHHKDDLLETVVINMLRGTGRKGLGGLRSTDIVKRPLLNRTKADLLAYAQKHGLQWREDSTNTDTNYLRNHIRHQVLPRLSENDRQKLHAIAQDTQQLNSEIDNIIAAFLQAHTHGGKLETKTIVMLPHAVAREVMAAWLRMHNIRTFDKKMLERLAHASKIHRVGREVAVNKMTVLRIYDGFLALERMER